MRAKSSLLLIIILAALASCQKTADRTFKKITTGPGPEDIVLDKANKRILVSCNERRSGYPLTGDIYTIDLQTDACKVLPRTDYPNIPFNPHGFDLQYINGTPYLYAINHYRDSSGITSVVQFEIRAADLLFVREYKNPLLISPNDLTVLPNGSFYFSNDKNSQDITELLTNPKGGSLVYCDGNTAWKKVDSVMAFPNGLYNEGNKLYLATSRNTALYVYDMQPDGSLLNKTTLCTINGIDNITPLGDDLIAAVHPDFLKFSLLSLIPSTLSPSRTYAINKKTGASRVIFDDDGRAISGSSTGLVCGDNLYLSQVYGEYVLKVENYDH